MVNLKLNKKEKSHNIIKLNQSVACPTYKILWKAGRIELFY